jgi:hypothetical protein
MTDAQLLALFGLPAIIVVLVIIGFAAEKFARLH